MNPEIKLMFRGQLRVKATVKGMFGLRTTVGVNVGNYFIVKPIICYYK